MTNKKAFIFVLTGLLAGWSLTPHTATATSETTLHQRVLQSGTLRCGYFEEAPFTYVDPNTKAMSGIAVELAEKAAKELNLKIEWSPVASFATLTQDLQSGQYDAICASVFTLPRAGRMDYTASYSYVPVNAYTKTESPIQSLAAMDWTNTKIAGLDGEGATTIATKRLPEAQFVTLPEQSSIAEMLATVATGKADIAFVMPTVFENFDKTNQGALRAVDAAKPFHVFPVSFGIKPNEPAFKNMLDTVIRNLINSGEMDALMDKYDSQKLLYRAERDYAE